MADLLDKNLKKVCFDTLRGLRDFAFKHEVFTDIDRCESPRVKNTALKAYFCLPYYTILFCVLSDRYPSAVQEPSFMDINDASIFVDDKSTPLVRP